MTRKQKTLHPTDLVHSPELPIFFLEVLSFVIGMFTQVFWLSMAHWNPRWSLYSQTASLLLNIAICSYAAQVHHRVGLQLAIWCFLAPSLLTLCYGCYSEKALLWQSYEPVARDASESDDGYAIALEHEGNGSLHRIHTLFEAHKSLGQSQTSQWWKTYVRDDSAAAFGARPLPPMRPIQSAQSSRPIVSGSSSRALLVNEQGEILHAGDSEPSEHTPLMV